ncbi:MAG: ABC transporter permease [Bacillota bacterium]
MDWELLLSYSFLVGLLSATIRMAAPLLLAGLGGVFTARVGIVNIAMEGTMLVGAFTAFWGAHLTGNPLWGALFGIAGGVLIGLLLGFISVTVRANQVVGGTAINIFALGITSFLMNVVFGIGVRPSAVTSFRAVPIPYLEDIPLLGPMLFNHISLVYLSLLLVPVVWYVIYRTPIGLSMRAVGEHPRAADTLGVKVGKVRYAACLVAGAFGGLAGAFLSIGQLSVFMENITAGRGYIAVAAVTFGKWNPFGVLGSALLFGAAEGFQLRLQSAGVRIPYQFLLMLPYVLTMVALAGLVGRATPPAAMGKPYAKEGGR